MLALAYSNDTLDIYDGAVCYMFYRFFEKSVGMVWVRILLPKDFDENQISNLFKSLKMYDQRSFDYWSARSRLNEFTISRYFQKLNDDCGYWRSKYIKFDSIPQYQMRCALSSVIVYNEPILFSKNIDYKLDYELARVYSNWKLACLFASGLRNILVTVSGARDWLFPKQLASLFEYCSNFD